VQIGDDLDACRAPVKAQLALYVGGMGARNKNFYNDYAKALGFEDAAVKIQDLFLDRKRAEAAAAVPDEFVDAIALVGPKERIAERLEVWKAAFAKGHVASILLRSPTVESLRTVAEIAF
jgi:alkanesulfonate monooxygenase SsuD/methylene tetrahydromethanopterin reductase-like flavin-dependent oxidoreductase (luciferase family)